MMPEFISQINWPSFFFGMLVSIIILNLSSLINAYWLKKRAEKRVAGGERQLAGMRAKLKEKERQLLDLINKREKK
jgi:hypothetical protein